MKKLVSILILLALVGLGYYALKEGKGAGPNTEKGTYSRSEVGLEFDYPAGPGGYVVDERMPVDLGTGLLRNIILMQSEDAEQEPPVGGEGPPVIVISVFENAEKQFPRSWAEENIQYSNLNLLQGEVEEDVVGGANAIRYMADGLYASENVVVAHGDNIYVITGQFMDQESDIRRDFGVLVESVRFIPAL